MVNTWQTSYFQTEGIRVLFVLPQSWTDAFIPMNIDPQPRKIVRVMVGRLEMLSADRQRKAEAAIASLASARSGRKRAGLSFPVRAGSIRRADRPARRQDDQGRRRCKTLCRRLLSTDFVTDLRAAIHNASDGKPLNADPLLLRAQLARLLRQVGQDAEARSRRAAVLKALARFRCRRARRSRARTQRPRSRAAALEAMGDDAPGCRGLCAAGRAACSKHAGEFVEAQIPVDARLVGRPLLCAGA